VHGEVAGARYYSEDEFQKFYGFRLLGQLPAGLHKDVTAAPNPHRCALVRRFLLIARPGGLACRLHVRDSSILSCPR
jgi:hypothetical protein